LGEIEKPGSASRQTRARGRLGQAMEISEFQKRLTDEACLLRGKIITGYSHVEYVLADISVRLGLKFPSGIKDRIKAVKQIVDRPEYEAYRNDFHRVCDELLQYDDLRNFMAHGVMTLESNRDQTSHRFVLQRYERLATGKFCHRALELSVEDFRRRASEMTKYTQDAYAVFKKFYLEQDVENVQDGR
jgi:hypothetical protein